MSIEDPTGFALGGKGRSGTFRWGINLNILQIKIPTTLFCILFQIFSFKPLKIYTICILYSRSPCLSLTYLSSNSSTAFNKRGSSLSAFNNSSPRRFHSRNLGFLVTHSCSICYHVSSDVIILTKAFSKSVISTKTQLVWFYFYSSYIY